MSKESSLKNPTNLAGIIVNGIYAFMVREKIIPGHMKKVQHIPIEKITVEVFRIFHSINS